jgi:hypothetical protein
MRQSITGVGRAVPPAGTISPRFFLLFSFAGAIKRSPLLAPLAQATDSPGQLTRRDADAMQEYGAKALAFEAVPRSA